MRGVIAIAVLVTAIAAACSTGQDDGEGGEPDATHASSTTTEGSRMQVTSPAFPDGKPIPTKHSCDGEDISPHLDIGSLPLGTATIVLIMDDPDAPGGTWDHWVAYDIEPAEAIAEGDHSVGTSGVNSWKTTGYGGPCPPSGEHRYFFKLYALDIELGAAEGLTKTEVLAAAEGHILADATLMGTFSR